MEITIPSAVPFSMMANLENIEVLTEESLISVGANVVMLFVLDILYNLSLIRVIDVVSKTNTYIALPLDLISITAPFISATFVQAPVLISVKSFIALKPKLLCYWQIHKVLHRCQQRKVHYHSAFACYILQIIRLQHLTVGLFLESFQR